MPTTTSPPEGQRASRLLDSAVLAGLVLLVFAIHAASPVTTSTDSAWTFHVAASILREGDVDLDEYRAVMDLDADYRLRRVNGHIYYYYPVATPLLVTPVVALTNAVLPLWRGTDFYSYLATHGPDERTAKLEKLAASTVVALATAAMYLVARRFLVSGKAIAIALIFAFGTSMWSTASRALWQHGPSVLLLTVTLYLSLVAPRRTWAVFLVGLLLALAYLVRPTNSLSFLFIGLYHLLNNPRRVWAFVLGGLAIFAPYVLHNWVTYGNVFPPYSYQLFERLGTPAEIGEAAAGTLVSPNRGLLVFTPVFLFAIAGAYRRVRANGLKTDHLDVFVIAVVVGHWITTSAFEDWGGAWSIGPRYFVDMIPYFAFFLIPVLEDGMVARPVWKTLFALTVGVGVLVQLHCSVSPYPFMWNGKPQALVEAPERKWDWADLQFLRGLCGDDPLEGRAPACWMESVD